MTCRLAEVGKLCQTLPMGMPAFKQEEPQHIRYGRFMEALTVLYLTCKGYRVLRRNRKFTGVEVDILAKCRQGYVVVEVKARRDFSRGSMPLSPIQLQRLQRVTEYVSRTTEISCRLDCVSWARIFPFVKHYKNILGQL